MALNLEKAIGSLTSHYKSELQAYADAAAGVKNTDAEKFIKSAVAGGSTIGGELAKLSGDRLFKEWEGMPDSAKVMSMASFSSKLLNSTLDAVDKLTKGGLGRNRTLRDWADKISAVTAAATDTVSAWIAVAEGGATPMEVMTAVKSSWNLAVTAWNVVTAAFKVTGAAVSIVPVIGQIVGAVLGVIGEIVAAVEAGDKEGRQKRFDAALATVLPIGIPDTHPAFAAMTEPLVLDFVTLSSQHGLGGTDLKDMMKETGAGLSHVMKSVETWAVAGVEMSAGDLKESLGHVADKLGSSAVDNAVEWLSLGSMLVGALPVAAPGDAALMFGRLTDLLTQGASTEWGAALLSKFGEKGASWNKDKLPKFDGAYSPLLRAKAARSLIMSATMPTGGY